ncbi:hypothetical protein PsYK624_085280 [Phanerochaete sordida]|uniref:Uncharacterized protein n=1 Tax=Phanerochaete sordida TaxID=48140 RepID=A0A9P3GEQ2_9APHY|nr:hypothetical protein PsYK624_085280 [Phanerochaete sordida]
MSFWTAYRTCAETRDYCLRTTSKRVRPVEWKRLLLENQVLRRWHLVRALLPPAAIQLYVEWPGMDTSRGPISLTFILSSGAKQLYQTKETTRSPTRTPYHEDSVFQLW